MNPLDWLLALALAYSVTRAILRGFIVEATSLLGTVFGFLFACWFYLPASLRLVGLINSPQLSQLVAFILILVATIIVATILGKVLHKTASAVGLGFFDRLFGALFGLLRGGLLCLSLLLAVTAFLPTAPWVQGSLLAPYFLSAAHAVSFIMPSSLKLRLLDGLDHIKHTSPHWIKSANSSHNSF